ncbi:MAG: integrase domain-containing protein, partial [Gammaproteobacteria bacterium]|nr:integrase domain-containing protein [Gammaproteobacteria bacterium]
EAIKFQPAYADQGDRLVLKASWTKGGKAREIPIRTDDQRAALKAAHQVAGRGSLIAPERTYVQQLRVYERQTANAGLSKLHGLRHQYAQARYHALTEEMSNALGISGGGWRAPVDGGPSRTELSAAQRGIDRLARVRVSRELGHEREQITAVYLGR